MIVYNSIFVKKETSNEDYDKTTNTIYWIISITLCVLKWIFSFMYLFQDNGSLAMGLILLILPVIRLSVIGVRNFIDFTKKFQNNCVRLLMSSMIFFESFVEVPSVYFCFQHIYFYSNYYQIYDAKTWMRTVNLLFNILEQMLIAVFGIAYLTKEDKKDFITIPIIVISMSCLILCFNIFLLVIDLMIKGDEEKGIKRVNSIFSSKEQRTPMKYYNPVMRDYVEKYGDIDYEQLDKDNEMNEIDSEGVGEGNSRNINVNSTNNNISNVNNNNINNNKQVLFTAINNNFGTVMNNKVSSELDNEVFDEAYDNMNNRNTNKMINDSGSKDNRNSCSSRKKSNSKLVNKENAKINTGKNRNTSNTGYNRNNRNSGKVSNNINEDLKGKVNININTDVEKLINRIKNNQDPISHNNVDYLEVISNNDNVIDNQNKEIHKQHNINNINNDVSLTKAKKSHININVLEKEEDNPYMISNNSNSNSNGNSDNINKSNLSNDNNDINN